jgi:hypothetical protein
MVDDMLFFNDIDIDKVIRAGFLGKRGPQTLGVHLKLSPNIQYSHTNDKLIRLPKTMRPEPLSPSFLDHSQMGIFFKRDETNFDWNYPFDFCGSIYRLEFV